MTGGFNICSTSKNVNTPFKPVAYPNSEEQRLEALPEEGNMIGQGDVLIRLAGRADHLQIPDHKKDIKDADKKNCDVILAQSPLHEV